MRCPARPAARFVYFVWSPDLHHRFEAAVAELGLEKAKPQAIAQIIDLHGENAPTRLCIKSHLQK